MNFGNNEFDNRTVNNTDSSRCDCFTATINKEKISCSRSESIDIKIMIVQRVIIIATFSPKEELINHQE